MIDVFGYREPAFIGENVEFTMSYIRIQRLVFAGIDMQNHYREFILKRGKIVTRIIACIVNRVGLFLDIIAIT